MKIIILALLFVIIAVQAAFAKVPEGRQAVLRPTQNSKTEGLVTFEETKEGVRVKGEIKNLTPGDHGFHIHEKGDCSAPDAKSAGDHFNPRKKPHGPHNSAWRHAGDFGNITAGKDGVAKIDFIDKELKFSGVESAAGKALIVHAKADDLKTQPTGDSGDRLACGVIN